MAAGMLTPVKKSVADPRIEYESAKRSWQRSRAACNGEYYVKAMDELVGLDNMLIPFSPSMSQQQYDFYKAEAEYPGIVAQYSRMLVSGLIRKVPQVTFPDGTPDEIRAWIMKSFCQDGNTLVAFLDQVLWEEIQTSRAWVHVDYPVVTEAQAEVTDFNLLAPYPVIWKAESVVNWKASTVNGKQVLQRVIVRMLEEVPDDQNEFHDKCLDTVFVHELVNGFYQVRKFQLKEVPPDAKTIAGEKLQDYKSGTGGEYELIETYTPLMRGERINTIPAWPLNGSIDIQDPILVPLVDREVGLYNKSSRRNHLLYGASTYTPVMFTQMSQEDFDNIVAQGLGTWLKLGPDDRAEILETPTGALQDMEKAIASTLEEMARMGVRMLAPETAQSGVALDIRNAGQVAQLSSLNTKISATLSTIIAYMINFRTGAGIVQDDVPVTLSQDFDPSPLGADWLRLITEWYEKGLIARSLWITILKLNDVMPSDYDDTTAVAEISSDPLVYSQMDQQVDAFNATQQAINQGGGVAE